MHTLPGVLRGETQVSATFEVVITETHVGTLGTLVRVESLFVKSKEVLVHL